MMSYYLPRLLYIRQQKGHVQGQRQNLFLAAYVVVTKLYQMIYVVFLGMAQNGLGALGIAGNSFYLDKGAFSVEADNKVNLQTGIFMEIIELAAHFREDVGNQPLKDGAFVAQKISL